MRHLFLVMAVVATVPAMASGQSPAWMKPTGATDAASKFDTKRLLHLPGSSASFTEAQLHDPSHAPDWYPNEHPPLPAAVAHGQEGANACGFCHMPDGSGRPTTAALAGLPAPYIERQVMTFSQGQRRDASPHLTPTPPMIATAKTYASAGVVAAAKYFSRLRFTSRVRVIESDVAPAGDYLASLSSRPATEPLGERIVERPVSAERFKLRDPHVRFVAYVPRGAINRGARLAAAVGPLGMPCAGCHGDGLRGGTAPPLAGRSPSYLVRQLWSFNSETRTSAEASTMRQIMAKFTLGQMIDLAAYSATLKP